MQKRALITGITGQDGSYLAELLLDKGYEVFGIMRRSSNVNTIRIQHILDKITLIPADLTDLGSLIRAMEQAKPDEVYNLAAMSFVPFSWAVPYNSVDIGALGVLNVLESIRIVNPKIKFYQASSSEMFGKVRETPQNEHTPFYPRSPYGLAKVTGHWLTVNYRESYNIFACSGICFNHESPRRGPEFVSRKISLAVARIACGMQDKLYMGNIDARRDWGFAPDYVAAMWQMLQHPAAQDYVIATGEAHTVKEFLEIAFEIAGLNYSKYVEIDPKLYRPAEVDILLGDAAKIRKELGWKPTRSFSQLVTEMVESDLEALQGVKI